MRYRERGGRWNYTLTDVTDGPVGEAMRLLARWHRKRNRVPPHELLAEVLSVTKAGEAFRLKPAGDQRAANLEKLLSDPEEMDCLSRAGKKGVEEHFHIDMQAERMIAVYESAIKTSKTKNRTRHFYRSNTFTRDLESLSMLPSGRF